MSKRDPIRSYAIAVLMLCAQGGLAQDQLTLEALKAPGMPAATIIGTQINEITRPKSLKALEAAILGNFLYADQRSITIPNSFGLEVQPFMLGSLQEFDYEDYIDDHPGMGNVLWRNLAISAASTKQFMILDSTASDALGTGLRLVFCQGKVSDDLKNAFKAAEAANLNAVGMRTAAMGGMDQALFTNPAATTAQLKADALQYVDAALTNNATFTALNAAAKTLLRDQVKAALDLVPDNMAPEFAADKFKEAYDSMFLKVALTEFRKVIERVGTERYGLHVEVNGATSWHFPTNEVGYAFTGRYGAWLTVAYRPKKMEGAHARPSASDFILLVRGIGHHGGFYDRYNPVDTSFNRGTNLDLGLKYAYSRARWSMELELIQRMNRVQEKRMFDGVEYHRNIDNTSTKLMLNFNYAIAPNVNLSYNFGKGFNDLFTPGDLISLVNLNLGFGALDAKKLIK